MELVTGTEVLEASSREGYAVKAFNINKQEIPQGVVAGCVKETLCLKGLQEVKRRIGIHLVLHGASSAPQHFLELVNKYGSELQKTTDVPLEHVKEAITLGTNTINTDTDLGLALTGTLRKALVKDRTIRDLRKPLGSARDLIKEAIKDKIELFGSVGMIRERR